MTADTDPAAKPAGELDVAEAKAELRRLADAIAEADRRYHVEDAPVLTDAEYDALRRRNTDLEERFPDLKLEDSPSERVAPGPAEGFAKVRHARPMLSLANAFRSEEHTSELQSLMRISYAVFCLKKKKLSKHTKTHV